MLYPIDEIEAELVPQAILKRPVEQIVGDRKIMHGSDDLDAYEGASFKLVDGPAFALRHYSGYPAGTAVIYLSSQIRDIEVISALVGRIVCEFGLEPADVEWQRREGPDL